MLEDLRNALHNNTVPPNVGICFINNLPPELLAQIFEVGSADVDTEPKKGSGDEDGSLPFQILISHVCRFWRTVAFSTPSLWTTIVVTPEARPPYERVATLLERSKNFPLDIHIDCGPPEHGYGEVPSEDNVKFLFSMFTPHIHRWRTMQLYVTDYQYMYSYLSAVSDPSILVAPQLMTLELCYYGVKEHGEVVLSQDLTVFGGSAPLLTRLALVGVHVDWNQPWIASASNLTDLELAFHPEDVRPSWAELATILRSASALEKLSLRQSGPSGDPWEWFLEPTTESPVDLNAPVQLLRVTYFVLAHLPEAYAVGLLRKFYLPALKYLVLDFHRGDYANLIRELSGPATSLSLAQEEPCSLLSRLESLEIRGLPCHTNSIRTLYRELQNLTSLGISLSWYLPRLFLEVLCTPCKLHGRDDIWLPRLQALYVSMASSSLLRELVQKRRDKGVPLQSLYVEKLDIVNKEDVVWLENNLKTFMSRS